MFAPATKAPADDPPHYDVAVERRRAPRVLAQGLVSAHLAVRGSSTLHPLAGRDVSCVGLGLVGDKALPVSVGERVYLLLDFQGEGTLLPVRGALLRARIRRRRPDVEGWFVGVEIDDLRESPWQSLVRWLDRELNAEPHTGPVWRGFEEPAPSR